VVIVYVEYYQELLHFLCIDYMPTHTHTCENHNCSVVAEASF